MKTDSVFKRAFNDGLDLISSLRDGEPLPSENELGARLDCQPHHGSQDPLYARGTRGRRRQRASAFRSSCGHSAAAVSGSRDGPDVRTGREAFHGVDAAGQHPPGNKHQRAGTGAAVRRGDDRHPGVPQPLSAFRSDREAAERRLGVQRLYAQLCARAVRDSRDVRATVGDGLRDIAGGLAALAAAASVAR